MENEERNKLIEEIEQFKWNCKHLEDQLAKQIKTNANNKKEFAAVIVSLQNITTEISSIKNSFKKYEPEAQKQIISSIEYAVDRVLNLKTEVEEIINRQQQMNGKLVSVVNSQIKIYEGNIKALKSDIDGIKRNQELILELLQSHQKEGK